MGDGDGLPGPADAWTTLAGLARDTRRLRLGSPVTFPHVGPLAVAVAQVDQMSGGRIELGLGVGWYEAKHRAQGLAFPPIGERFDMLEDTLEILTGMWNTPVGETFDFSGRRLAVEGSPALPKPEQRPGPPLITGGSGPRRTPRLAARFATEFNLPFTSPEAWSDATGIVRDACRATGLDPDDLIYSTAQVVCCGSDDTELERRSAAIGRQPAYFLTAPVCRPPRRGVGDVRSPTCRYAQADFRYMEVERPQRLQPHEALGSHSPTPCIRR
jgi:alkanesulfonate monooxygenase SsuD/methylene tetrahydromethanopterin reductase-like flavin-dependent oxidoreductase (luciferase family)